MTACYIVSVLLIYKVSRMISSHSRCTYQIIHQEKVESVPKKATISMWIAQCRCSYIIVRMLIKNEVKTTRGLITMKEYIVGHKRP